MMKSWSVRTAIIGSAAAVTLSLYASPALAVSGREPGGALSTAINHAIRAGGPFFTPAEQAVINAKCGYAPGEWDGYDVNISNGVFQCKNGKTIKDAEMRALLNVAQPRISARVTAAMARPEVKSAIRDVAEDAARKAIANLSWNRDAR